MKFLQDGKPLLAILFPPFWLAWHRLWWALGVYAAFAAIIALLAFTPWQNVAFLLSALPGLYLLFEGHELVRQRLEQKGWIFDGVIEGRDEEEAEFRYFSVRKQATTHPLPVEPHQVPHPVSPSLSQVTPQSIGLFPLEG